LPFFFWAAWLGGWMWGALAVGSQLRHASRLLPDHALDVLWLGFWLLVGGSWLVSFAWMLVGEERMLFRQGTLTLEYRLLGIARRKHFDMRNIQNWRVAATPGEPQIQRRLLSSLALGSGGTIAFDYGAKTVQCGARLDEAEARQLLTFLDQRRMIHQSTSAA